jgi:hypothetical protein
MEGRRQIAECRSRLRRGAPSQHTGPARFRLASEAAQSEMLMNTLHFCTLQSAF